MTTLILPPDFSGDNIIGPYLSWDNGGVASSAGYEIEIALDSAFASVAVSISDVLTEYFDFNSPTGTVVTTEAIAYNKRYYWRARMQDDGGGPYPWSDIFTFTVIPTPTPLKPIITNPVTGDEVARPEIITFEESLFSDNHYVEISENGSFRDLVVDKTTDKPNITVILDYGKTYYLRIKGKGIGGFGEYSEVVEFTVEDAP